MAKVVHCFVRSFPQIVSNDQRSRNHQVHKGCKWSTYTVCLVNTVILKLGKEKQLPTTSFPFQLHWFHYWPNWQNQLRPGCELRLIFSPPSRLRSGLPEVVEGWLAPPVLVRGLLSPQLGAPSQGVSHCQNCSNFAQFFIHSMRGRGLKCSKNRHLGFL